MQFSGLWKIDPVTMAETELELLFRACDKKGTGKIGPKEFRELCAEFDIGDADCNAIFSDLDHDGDGHVSLEDFAWGFRDFLKLPTSRRESIITFESNIRRDDEPAAALDVVHKRHSEARQAWAHLVEGVGEASINKFLNSSGKKLADLYREMRSLEVSPHLVSHFEGAFSSLLEDVQHLHDDNQKLEEMFNREREKHIDRLRGLEEELDAQVARIESEAREEARNKFEQEKKSLIEKMESETLELQTHLRLFQKVNSVLLKGKEKCKDISEQAYSENRELRMMLADTKTNLALLHSEMAQLRADYEKKCKELNDQKVTVSQYQEETNQIHQHLSLMQEVNYKLQDTNDSLLTVMDSTPRTSPIICSPPSSLELETEEQRKPKWIISNYRSTSPGNIVHEPQIGITGFVPYNLTISNQYNNQGPLDDYDSGRSTIRDPVDFDNETNYADSFRISDSEYHRISLDNYSLTSAPYRPSSLGSSISLCEMDCTGPPDRTYKIVFAGDAAVGKSCFIHRFCKGTFTLKLGSTLGVDFQIKTFRIDNKNIVLQLWDTAGQERFRSMTKTYFRRADGVLLLYDVNNEKSFLSIQNWIQSIDEVTEKNIPIYICGNKVDMRADSLQQGITCVREQDGERIARDHGATFFETSSKTGLNITNALIGITRDMLAKEDVEVQTSVLAIGKEPVKKSCCK